MFSIVLMEQNESASYKDFRLKLMQVAQKQWDGFYKSAPDKDASFPRGLAVCFADISKWLGDSVCGRVLHLRLESDGRSLEAINAADAGRLIGPGKTLGTLAAEFGLI